MIRPFRYRPWKGFGLIGLTIALPLVLGVDRYLSGWIAFAGMVAAVRWSFEADENTERAIRRLKLMRKSRRQNERV